MNNKGQIRITGNSNLDCKIEKFLSEYVDYIQDAIKKAKENQQIDNKSIYALGDVVRNIQRIKKALIQSIEPSKEVPVEVTLNNKVNIRIQCIILSYISYVNQSIADAKNGIEIDNENIYVLGDAVKNTQIIRKITERPIESPKV